jgi:hypothetical protein
MTVRLLHLADVHLGAAFPWLGERGAVHRRRLRQTFADALQHAVSEQVGLVLIAGDLFASAQPHPELVEFVLAQFTRLTGSGIEVVVAAGESDPLDAQGLYAGGALDGLPGVTILPAQPRVVEFPDLGIAVSGRSAVRVREPADPFKGLTVGKAPETVGLLAIDPHRAGGREVLARALAATRFRYVALGGSHKTLDVSTDGVPAWYPGSLELLARAEPPGSALLVEVGSDGVVVTTRGVARGRAQRVVLEPAAFASTDALDAEIEAQADPELSLEVRLAGRARPAQFVDGAALERRLAARFFTLDIADDALPDLTMLPEAPGGNVTVTGKFTELMAAQLQHAGAEPERRRIGAAFRLGLWLLGGRKEAT